VHPRPKNGIGESMTQRPFAAMTLLVLAACDPPDSSPCDAPVRSAGSPAALFDGATLTGWDGDPAVWSVQNGNIVGKTASGKVAQNTFLIYRGGELSDFLLTAEVMLPAGGNSGIQYRSTVVDAGQWIVAGYQADIADNGWGNVYEERLGRNHLAYASQACRDAAKIGGWNTYEITANGCRISQRLNGVHCADFGEGAADRPKAGVIALQYHAPGGFEVRARNVVLAPLQ
jgi:hypothetical protein